MQTVTGDPAPPRDRAISPGRGRVWLRFAAGSVVATVLSQIAFTVTFGLLNAPAAVASVVAFFAGAVPNYLLSTAWAWGDRGSAGKRTAIVPYLVVILVTNLLAIGATTLADAWVRGHVASHTTRTLLVDLAYLAAYGAMFALKFLLFDGLVFKESSHQPSRRLLPAVHRRRPRVKL
ncbi:GtrA family protein [Streptomyces sp. RB6PN25]|uniref:GtrA family protein n=1 Tax=Streptomyces humicola TaxID=2953240 RepID=A0ABT1PQY5_9ACTN|nr:GtrA family protein [Streptomyces humicola]MCQ4079553.1 GtrA family protein [Streptomyces humicola]